MPENRPSKLDDELLPSYTATKSQQDSVANKLNANTTRMPKGAVISQLQAMLSAYRPTASKMVDPLTVTSVKPLHGGGAVVVGGRVTELGTKMA